MRREVSLCDIASYISRGVTPKYTDSKDGLTVINQRCIRGWSINFESARRTDVSVKKVSDDKLLLDGDILVCSTGVGTLGRVGQYWSDGTGDRATVDSHVTIVRSNDAFVYPKYLGYVLKSRQSEIEQLAEGSTGQIELPRTKLGNLSIDLPDMATQRRIADILGSLDDKIELNRQMNETLKQIGQALFRHYFIDNPDAKNWPDATLGDLVKPRRGKSLTSKLMCPGAVPVVSGGLKPAGYHNESNTVAPVITISASGANAGYVALWGDNVWSADSSFIDSTMTDYIYYLYYVLESRQKEIYDSQTGSGQPHVYPSHIERLGIKMVPVELVDRFCGEAAYLFRLIWHNEYENSSFSESRETLMNMLIG